MQACRPTITPILDFSGRTRHIEAASRFGWSINGALLSAPVAMALLWKPKNNASVDMTMRHRQNVLPSADCWLLTPHTTACRPSIAHAAASQGTTYTWLTDDASKLRLPILTPFFRTQDDDFK